MFSTRTNWPTRYVETACAAKRELTGRPLSISRSASRALSHTLPEKIAAAVYEFITGPLLENPQRVGKALNPPLAPAYSARRGAYRVLYRIDIDSRTVEAVAVAHRADAYR